MAPQQRPTSVIIAHGAFPKTSAYDDLTQDLAARGLKTLVPQLPSADPSPPPDAFDADVAVLRQTIQRELDEHHDLVVLCHSYGGLPGCQALEGILNQPLSSCGTGTRVLGIVFLSSFVAHEGQSLVEAREGRQAPWLRVEDDLACANDAAIVFFNRIPNSAARARQPAACLTAQSLATFLTSIRYAAWEHLPSFYVRCAEDKALDPEEQDFYMARLGGAATFAGVAELSGDHCPQNSMPRELVECIAGTVTPALGLKGEELASLGRKQAGGGAESTHHLQCRSMGLIKLGHTIRAHLKGIRVQTALHCICRR